MEQNISFDLKGILRPAIELFEVVPAVGRVAVQEYASRCGIAQAGLAGELLDLVILVVPVKLVYCYSLCVNRHFYAVREALGDGII